MNLTHKSDYVGVELCSSLLHVFINTTNFGGIIPLTRRPESPPMIGWSTLQDVSLEPLFDYLTHTQTHTLKTIPAFTMAAGKKLGYAYWSYCLRLYATRCGVWTNPRGVPVSNPPTLKQKPAETALH